MGRASSRAVWTHLRSLYLTPLGSATNWFNVDKSTRDTSSVIIRGHKCGACRVGSVGWCIETWIGVPGKNLSLKMVALPSIELTAGLERPYSKGNSAICLPFWCFARDQMLAESTAS